MNFSAFEHKFIRSFHHYFKQIENRKFFLAVSGGIDSIVLLHLFYKFQQLMNAELTVAYVHHGVSSDQKLTAYRKKSLEFVKQQAELLDLNFVTNSLQIQKELLSEQDLREWRYHQFKVLMTEDQILVLAHHLDDQLESRLLDLIRGSHFHHWEKDPEFSDSVYRPLSQVRSIEIQDYAAKNNLIWVEDPTNSELKSSRNWLRNKLLKDLEEKFPGSNESLMKNLTKLYQFSSENEEIPGLKVSMNEWMLFSTQEKQRFVLKTSLELKMKSMTQGQVKDIVRKLDLSQKDIKFQTGPIFWVKTSDKIYALRSSDEK